MATDNSYNSIPKQALGLPTDAENIKYTAILNLFLKSHTISIPNICFRMPYLINFSDSLPINSNPNTNNYRYNPYFEAEPEIEQPPVVNSKYIKMVITEKVYDTPANSTILGFSTITFNDKIYNFINPDDIYPEEPDTDGILVSVPNGFLLQNPINVLSTNILGILDYAFGINSSTTILFEFPTQIILNKYNLKTYSPFNATNFGTNPTSWTIESSNDGINYILLHTVNDYNTSDFSVDEFIGPFFIN